jgi:hypothetical protein
VELPYGMKSARLLRVVPSKAFTRKLSPGPVAAMMSARPSPSATWIARPFPWRSKRSAETFHLAMSSSPHYSPRFYLRTL